MEAKIEPLGDALPSIAWRWDPETDILSGSFKGNRKSGGLTGTVELTDAEGSVAVLDVNGGMVCGTRHGGLARGLHALGNQGPGAAHRRPCRAPLRSRPERGLGRGGHQALGAHPARRERVPPPDRRPPAVEVVPVADNFYVEVDQQGGLAGFWMTERAAVQFVPGGDVSDGRCGQGCTGAVTRPGPRSEATRAPARPSLSARLSAAL